MIRLLFADGGTQLEELKACATLAYQAHLVRHFCVLSLLRWGEWPLIPHPDAFEFLHVT
jgi:hypothetical protein